MFELYSLILVLLIGLSTHEIAVYIPKCSDLKQTYLSIRFLKAEAAQLRVIKTNVKISKINIVNFIQEEPF